MAKREMLEAAEEAEAAADSHSEGDAEAEAAEDEEQGSDFNRSEGEVQEQRPLRGPAAENEDDDPHSENKLLLRDGDLDEEKCLSLGEQGEGSENETVSDDVSENQADEIGSDSESEEPRLARRVAPQRSKFRAAGKDPFILNDDDMILRVAVCPITHRTNTEERYSVRQPHKENTGTEKQLFERPATSYSGNWYLVGYPDPEPHERDTSFWSTRRRSN